MVWKRLEVEDSDSVTVTRHCCKAGFLRQEYFVADLNVSLMCCIYHGSILSINHFVKSVLSWGRAKDMENWSILNFPGTDRLVDVKHAHEQQQQHVECRSTMERLQLMCCESVATAAQLQVNEKQSWYAERSSMRSCRLSQGTRRSFRNIYRLDCWQNVGDSRRNQRKVSPRLSHSMPLSVRLGMNTLCCRSDSLSNSERSLRRTSLVSDPPRPPHGACLPAVGHGVLGCRCRNCLRWCQS